MIRALLPRGEIAVIGLGRSGSAVSRLLMREGAAVYASDEKTGGHDLERIARAVLVVTSPGVPPGAPPLAAARSQGVPVVSEVEVAMEFLPHTRLIAVTGTNGKTTVTALAAHLLQSLGTRAQAAGNIGTALSEVALMSDPPDWVALELSSYQLHDTPSVRPAVGVLTNLAPDHLDRYASLEDYYADKMLLFVNATAESVWITNADDTEVQRRTAGVPGTHNRFSLHAARSVGASASYDPVAGKLSLLNAPWLDRAGIPLLGDHNVANVLAAALAVTSASPEFATAESRRLMSEAVGRFKPMPHRLEIVADHNGVQWINDSKATNVSSARVAIEGMTRPAVVLLGGRHKGESYAGLIEPLKRHAKLVIAFGEARPIIAADLGTAVPLEQAGSSFTDVIARARAAAQPGDAVLLSPACSSFDMFKNYEERGAAFGRLANNI